MIRRLFALLLFACAILVAATADATPVHYEEGDFSFEIPPSSVCVAYPATLPGVVPCNDGRPYNDDETTQRILKSTPSMSVVTVLRFTPPNSTATLVVMQARKTPTRPMTGPQILATGAALERAVRAAAPKGTEVSSARNMELTTRGLHVARLSIDAKPPPEAAEWLGARQVHYIIPTAEATYALAFVTDAAHVNRLDALALTIEASVKGNPARSPFAYAVFWSMGRYGVYVVAAIVGFVAFLVWRYRRTARAAPARP